MVDNRLQNLPQFELFEKISQVADQENVEVFLGRWLCKRPLPQ